MLTSVNVTPLGVDSRDSHVSDSEVGVLASLVESTGNDDILLDHAREEVTGSEASGVADS